MLFSMAIDGFRPLLSSFLGEDIFIAMKMNRIAIIGSSGAGKSTLARDLGSILHIKVIHLDPYFWKPDWEERPKEERVSILHDLVQGAQWIIEGTYFTTSDMRLKEADTIIFLDMSRWLCVQRVIRRYVSYHNHKQPRLDLPDGCPDKLGFLYCVKILLFWFFGRRTIKWKLREIEPKKIIRLHSPEEVADFLDGLRQLVCETEHSPQAARKTPEKMLVSSSY
jgi:energy-coupling factor transporter ATP-binding protein EcfA2